MKRSARLTKLLELEASREREEARRLAEAQRLSNERRLRLTELEGYLGEYRRRFDAATRAGAAASRARAEHEFLNRLHGIVAQQGEAVAEAERGTEARREAWLQAKQRVDALSKTIERLDREQAARDRKQEQAVTDEAARRRFRPP
jgi:flagellar export protein FliJ